MLTRKKNKNNVIVETCSLCNSMRIASDEPHICSTRVKKPFVPTTDCTNLGSLIRIDDCVTCNPDKPNKIKVYNCSVYGECQIANSKLPIQKCASSCPGYNPS